MTSVKVLKNFEELLGELTHQLRALRPALEAASRTADQIQQGTDAIASARAPINAVREMIIPRRRNR